jgi:hypothetical protein
MLDGIQACLSDVLIDVEVEVHIERAGDDVVNFFR